MIKRFELENRIMKCNGLEIKKDEAIMLLNESDEIIFSLKKAFGYIIENNFDLTDYNNDDELFVYLEKIGVI